MPYSKSSVRKTPRNLLFVRFAADGFYVGEVERKNENRDEVGFKDPYMRGETPPRVEGFPAEMLHGSKKEGGG